MSWKEGGMGTTWFLPLQNRDKLPANEVFGCHLPSLDLGGSFISAKSWCLKEIFR